MPIGAEDRALEIDFPAIRFPQPAAGPVLGYASGFRLQDNHVRCSDCAFGTQTRRWCPAHPRIRTRGKLRNGGRLHSPEAESLLGLLSWKSHLQLRFES